MTELDLRVNSRTAMFTTQHAADWREADERNVIVLRQLADAGIGQ